VSLKKTPSAGPNLGFAVVTVRLSLGKYLSSIECIGPENPSPAATPISVSAVL
jgi:hypothetical protein